MFWMLQQCGHIIAPPNAPPIAPPIAPPPASKQIQRIAFPSDKCKGTRMDHSAFDGQVLIEVGLHEIPG